MKDRFFEARRQLIALKRFLLFAPGIVLFIAGFFLLFPSLDARLPASLSLLIIYIITAYLTIPLAFRLYRVFRLPNHLPRYSVTPDGLACDPVNIAVGSSRLELIDAMTASGWHKADQRSVRSLIQMGLSIILHHPYPNAPFSTLYLFGRGQDIGFQKPIEGSNSSSRRHHVRFWACIPAMMDGKNLEDAGFWDKLYPQVDKGEVLWVGCASRDIGIVPIKHNLQLTHRVAPNTDEERDLIVTDLKASGHVENVVMIKSGEPLALKNRAMNSSLVSDGTLAVVDLK